MTAQEVNEPRTREDIDESLFRQLESYPWHSDAEFQNGLESILGPDASPDQAEQLTLRARCFYFSRKNNISIDFDAYKTWRSQHTSLSLPNGDEPDAMKNTTEPPAPYPTSFSHIVELITNGQPIPGIKEVPNTVLEGQATQASTAKRKKPWEKDDLGDEKAPATVINP